MVEENSVAAAAASGGEATKTTAEEGKSAAPKEVIAEKVTGIVKWFNVKSGYGFINRTDTKEEIFIHRSGITRNNPNKFLRSVGDGEVVEFDVVVGEKGNEASNVSRVGGEAVKGSSYAAERGDRNPQFGFFRRGRGRGRGRGRFAPRSRDPATKGGETEGRNADDEHEEEEEGEDGQQQRGGRRFRGRGRPRFYRGFGGRRGGRRPRTDSTEGEGQEPEKHEEDGEGKETNEESGRGRGRGGRGGPRRGFRRFFRRGRGGGRGRGVRGEGRGEGGGPPPRSRAESENTDPAHSDDGEEHEGAGGEAQSSQ